MTTRGDLTTAQDRAICALASAHGDLRPWASASDIGTNAATCDALVNRGLATMSPHRRHGRRVWVYQLTNEGWEARQSLG